MTTDTRLQEGTGTDSRDAQIPPSAPSAAAALSPDETRRKALLRFAISITVLTVVGHTLLGFEQAPIVPIAAVITAYTLTLAMETLDAWAFRRPVGYGGGAKNLMYFLLPAHIAALACSMLIYADNVKPYLFAVCVAVVSKYVVRLPHKGHLKHFLNPSNAGIALVLLVMPTVGFTPPYMFLNNTDGPVDVLIPLGVLMAGTMLNAKLTHRMPLILAWVAGYILEAVVRTLLFSDNLFSALQMMTGVAFVLFTNYMITDPGTTPFKKRGQIVFGLATAATYGLLIAFGVAYAIFFSLTLVCAARGVVLAWSSVRHTRGETQGEPRSASTEAVAKP